MDVGTVLRSVLRSVALAVGFLMAGSAQLLAQPMPGECASGFCGTPKNNGGGGCGCGGGSILVNNTDIGQTYSKTDDYDVDGLADDFDNCPFMANRDQADKDGDKIGDVCDNCAGIVNPDQHDVNLNGTGDLCDADIDGDTIVNQRPDNCPAVPNLMQIDTDKDGLGDVCDADIDGDGVMNRADNCPLVSNPDQLKTAPGMYGDKCDADLDKDAIVDSKDNCPANYNPDQLDTNGNGAGDSCDADMDGDLVTNQVDNCPAVKNPDQKDADKDGVGDSCQTHGYCFVPYLNRSARCLDPKSVFSVTAAPRVKAQTGESLMPRIFANREGVSIKYSWILLLQPDGASDTVARPTGTVSESAAYEYHYVPEDRRPDFVPTHPGLYRLHLSADLVQADSVFPGVVHAENDVEVEVSGPVVSAGGCGLGGRAATGSGFALMGLLTLGGVLARRRRARA